MAALSSMRGLSFGIVAYDMASGAMLKANSTMRAMSATADKMGATMPLAFGAMMAGAAGAGLGIMGLKKAFSTIDPATEFGLAMERVGIVTRSTGQEFEDLKSMVQRLGLETEFTATEVAGASQILAQAGFTSKELSDGLAEATLNLTSASGGMITAAEAGGTLATTFKVFGGQFQNQAKNVSLMGDAMTRMTQMTKLQFTDLERGFAGISGEARIFQQDFFEVIAMMGAASNAGFGAAAGANALRISMRNLIGNTGRFEELTGKKVTEGGRFKSFLTVVDDMNEAWARTGADIEQRTADIMNIFTKRGLRGIGIIEYATAVNETTGELLRGTDAVRYWAEEARKAMGAMAKAADRIRRTFWGTLKRISGGLINLAIIIGGTVIPWMSKYAEAFFKATVVMNEFAIAHKGLVKWLFVAFTLMSALVTVAGSLALVAGGVLLVVGALQLMGYWEGIVTVSTFWLGVAQAALNGHMAEANLLYYAASQRLRILWLRMLPITTTLGALAVFAAGAVVHFAAMITIWKKWAGVAKAVVGASEPLKTTLEALGMLLSNNFRITDDMMKRMKSQGVVGIVTKIGSAFLWISKFVKQVPKAISLLGIVVKKAFGKGTIFNIIAEGFGGAFIDAMKLVLGEISLANFLDTLMVRFHSMKEKIREAFGRVLETILGGQNPQFQRAMDSMVENLVMALRSSVGLTSVVAQLTVLGAVIGYTLGGAIMKGIVLGLWDNRWALINVLLDITMWMLNQTSNIGLDYATSMIKMLTGDRVDASVPGEASQKYQKMARGAVLGVGEAGDKAVSEHIHLSIDGREIALAVRNYLSSEVDRLGASKATQRSGTGAGTDALPAPSSSGVY